MSRKDDAQHIAELESTNARLQESLKRCQQLVAECHAKLAANRDDEEAEPLIAKRRQL